jgi:DNA-binding response OmpR family regulator
MKDPGASTVRILVVEDEPSISQVCLRVLTAEGFDVDIAENGAKALDGKRLYRWIVDKRPQLVKGVLFTTGDSVNPDTGIFLERAGRPFLPKPFTLDELKAVVKETLSQVGK